uniref:Uncharacterized protein n=1 Tax=viral metagenome TaxID=1070528 RepID=A0A6C0JWG7_9ZZZZ
MASQYKNNKTEIVRNITAQKAIYKFRNFLYSNRKDIREQYFRMSKEYLDNEYQNNIIITITEKERLRLLLNHWDWNTFDTSSRDWWFILSFIHSRSLTLMTLVHLWIDDVQIDDVQIDDVQIDDVQIFDFEVFETGTDGLR